MPAQPTPLGFVIPGPNDPPAGNVQMQQLGESIDGYLQGRLLDTGWTQDGITMLNSFQIAAATSGWRSLAYRREGKTVSISGVISRATAWTANLPAFVMPATLLPSRQMQSAVCRIGEDGQVLVTSAGSGVVALFIDYMLP